MSLTALLLAAVAQAAAQPASGCTPEHAAMGHCTLPTAPVQQQSKPPAAAPTPDPHAGHTMPQQPVAADPHAGHDMGAAGQAGPEPGPPPSEALSGPAHAADEIFGPAMAESRAELHREHGGMLSYMIMVERAEAVVRKGRDGFAIDSQAWFGGDIDKLWLKAEAEAAWGEKLEHAELQALWSHAIDPWFDLQAGLRHDPQHGPDRTHAVLGLQGLMPHWWEVDAALFLSTEGELTARVEAEYDLRLTQELILQPRIEVDLSAQRIVELGIGSGLTEASAGFRLRYQQTPAFAPYVGVEYERAFGGTARFRRAEGESRDSVALLAGVRFFF
ncbi:copper resistance protein B [Sphingomonas mesophila]|uniref:copper resistance protein B n=1 Tax=Sphingomonas mesophila TaxID=2303576 RepID=UPI001F07F39C|nr:copper resistance protein B [Sphingomonas mesophila]